MDIDDELMKRLFYFSVAVLIAIILIWFGTKFLFYPSESINGFLLLLMGVGIILAGIFGVGALMAMGWPVMVGVLVLGLYFCMRAVGWIDTPWLARLLGILTWAAAGMVLYLAWPPRQIHKE